MRIGFACMYESLPDISPETFCILIASHLPYVFFHLPVPSSLPPPSHSSAAHEAALDPTTEPFKDAHQGFPGMLKRSEEKTGLVHRNRKKGK